MNRIYVIGGQLAGVSTALRLRRLDEGADITLVSSSEELMHAKSAIPYYINDVVGSRDSMVLRSHEEITNRFNINLMTNKRLVSISAEKMSIELADVNSEEKTEYIYDRLVLATGLKSEYSNGDKNLIFDAGKMSGADNLKGYIKERSPKNAIVLGNSNRAVEMADSLSELGINVCLCSPNQNTLEAYDRDMQGILDSHLAQNGVRLEYDVDLTSACQKEGKVGVVLKDKSELNADFAVYAGAGRPDTEVYKDTGLELADTGHVIVNSAFETSVPNIYAVGAVARIKRGDVLGKAILSPGEINLQSRIVADNIAGREKTYDNFLDSSIVKAFELSCARCGITESDLNKMGKNLREDYHIILMQPDSGDGFYPGHMPLTMKLIFDKAGLILGAQIVGYAGVDKRIDVIATAMKYGANVRDLGSLELAYAPPYSSANDPIHMAGFFAENLLDFGCGYAHIRELDDLDLTKNQILDIRDEFEYDMGTLEGAINLPLNQMRERLDDLDKSKPVYAFCKTGVRGYYAARILVENGFEVYNVLDGYMAYKHKNQSNDARNANKEGANMDKTGENANKSTAADVQNTSSQQAKSGTRYELNACGLQCPGPILQVYKRMEEINEGDVLDVLATDPGFASDIKVWCQRTGNTLLEDGKRDKRFYAVIQKGGASAPASAELGEIPHDKTIVVFSGDLDKAIAALIIANGAAAMGRKVTMFFTFWGLNVLRRHEKVSVQKDFIAKMFGFMMPRGSKKLALSKMNMGGMGAKMIRGIMKKNNVDSLETLIKTALDNGVTMIACNMSMDLMGIREEELIDGVTLGGVATYLGNAESADTNLFI